MCSMHYRPLPKGYLIGPSITKVRASTIATKIRSGVYDVIVFYTDKEKLTNAPITDRILGDEAVSLALQLLNKWADSEGKVEKCLLPTKRWYLHQEFMEYSYLYCQLQSNRQELIALVKK